VVVFLAKIQKTLHKLSLDTTKSLRRGEERRGDGNFGGDFDY